MIVIVFKGGKKGETPRFAKFNFLGIQKDFVVASDDNDNIYSFPLTFKFFIIKTLTDNLQIVVPVTPVKEECCICYENNVSPNKKLKCDHAICQNCTSNLEKLECPYCRQKIKIDEGYMTKQINDEIKNKILKEKQITELVDKLVSVHINNFQESKYIARDYAYAFRSILDESSVIDDTVGGTGEQHIIKGYLYFVNKCLFNGENDRPENYITKFSAEILQLIYNH